MISRCLYCYEVLAPENKDYHPQCSKKFFGISRAPEIPFSLSQIMDYAIDTLGKSISVTGVQPKISLETEKSVSKTIRFTLVGVPGNFILKPPIERFREMPENEDVTMHLAQLLKIKTAQHSLIRLASGEPAYITKRFDRNTLGKVPVEDMAQLTGTLTENKYRGSMERIAKVIEKYSDYPMFDLASFYELTLFAFVTGNADMHLKNFSLMTTAQNEVMLAPAYDLLATKLVIPDDMEELALPMNGKKSKLRKSDFISFAEKIGLSSKTTLKIHKKFTEKIDDMNRLIDVSFLSNQTKENYKALISERIERIK